jgi:hypothetical protein
MAIVVSVADPSGLLQKIRLGVGEEKIETWRVDSDGDFSHSPPQWINKAWFRPVIGPESLMFGLLGVKNTSMTKSVYGVYHGRFIEMLLSHFDGEFVSVSATAQKDARADSFT